MNNGSWKPPGAVAVELGRTILWSDTVSGNAYLRPKRLDRPERVLLVFSFEGK
jgi:hypothetical protein